MILYCEGCRVKVAIIVEGSKIKTGMVCLCSSCEIKRKASDLAERTKPRNAMDDILNSTIFGDMFGGKK